MKKIILIPTYNEHQNIIKLLPWILREDKEADILVIDDNSPDGTAQIVAKLKKDEERISLIVRKKKLGIGSALLLGYRYAVKMGYEFLLQMDADLSHNPHEIAKLFAQVDKHTIIIGSRYIKGGSCSGWASWRKLLSRFANLYVRFWLRTEVSDATSGFRVLPNSLMKKIIKADICLSSGYLFQIEVVWKAIQEGYKIKEVPIHFIDREGGNSKLGIIDVIRAAIGVPLLLIKTKIKIA